MIYGIHHHWPWKEILHLAVCIAAMSLSDHSSTNGMRDIQQCLELQKFGFRQLKL
jgi:sugar/nucleoside kinase (ribokinase family)